MCPSSTTSSDTSAATRSLAGEVRAGSVLLDRRAQRIVSVGFLVIIVGAALVDLCWPAAPKPLAGIHAQRLEEQRAATQWMDGTRMRLLEWDLRDTSRVREATLPLWSAFLFGAGRMPHSSVIPGADGWLYMKARVQPERRTAPLAQREAIRVLIAFDRVLAAMGTRLVLVPIPDKSMVHPEHLPAGFQSDAADYERFIAAWRARGLHVVDVLGAMREAGGQHFLRTDTHWTHRAARVTARAEMEAMGILSSVHEQASHWEEAGNELDAGDLLVSGGMDIRAMHHGDLTGKALRAMGALGEVPIEKFTGDQATLAAPDMQRPWAHYGSSFSSFVHFKQMLEWYAGERGFIKDFIAVDAEWIMLQLVTDLVAARERGIVPRAVAFEFLLTDFLTDQVAPKKLVFSQTGIEPPAPVPETLRPAMVARPRLVPGEHALTSRGIAWGAAPGAFVHPADGSFGVVIEGEVLSGAPTFGLNVGPTHLYIPWPPGARRVHVPLFGSGLAEGFHCALLDLADQARVRIDKVSLASPLTVGAAVSVPTPVGAVPGGWEADLEHLAGADERALFVQLTTGACERIELTSAECGEQLVIEKPAAQMRLVLPLVQGKPTKWRVRAQGSAKAVVFKEVSTLLQARR